MRKRCYHAEETAAKHARIVKEASRLFRERGLGRLRRDRRNVTLASTIMLS